MKIPFIVFLSYFLLSCGGNEDDSIQSRLVTNPTFNDSQNNNENTIIESGELTFEPEGRNRVILRWENTAQTTSTRVLRDGKEIATTSEAFYVDNSIEGSVSYTYEISRCSIELCQEPLDVSFYTSRNYDLINVNAQGFDDSFRNEIGVNLLFRSETGSKLLNRFLFINQSQTQGLGRTYGDGVYQLAVRSNPEHGQQCHSKAANREYFTDGLDATVIVDCLTPATLFNPNGNFDLESGFSSMSSPKLNLIRSNDNSVIATQKLKYETDNPIVASVDDAGVITTNSDGVASIRAYLDPSMYGDSASLYYDVNVSSTLNYRIRRVDFGQNLVFENGRKVKLAAGKNALIRAFLQARSKDNLIMPALSVVISTDNNRATFTMTCQDELPVTYLASNDYSLNNACFVQIPEGEISEESQIYIYDNSAAKEFDITPTIIANSYISLVLVPFAINQIAPTIPELNIIVDSVKKRLPFADIDIFIKPAELITQTSTSMVNILRATEAIRIRENGGVNLGLQQSHYVGVVADVLQQNILGIAFLDGFSSVIKDDFTNSVLEHELGHNFGLEHAPCGNPAGVDSFWLRQPEAWEGASVGKNSLVPIFDPVSNKIISPRGQGTSTEYDIMGYCGGAYFSEYNMQRIQAEIEKNPLYQKLSSRINARIALASKLDNILSISGIISNGVASSVSIEKSTGQKDLSEGLDVLYYKDASGALQFQYFTFLVASDGISRLFFINLPYQDSIELLYIFTQDNQKITLKRHP